MIATSVENYLVMGYARSFLYYQYNEWGGFILPNSAPFY